MKKLVLFAAFFSVICFGSCKNNESKENTVGESSTEQKVSPSTESENSQEVSPSGEEPKASEEQAPKGE